MGDVDLWVRTGALERAVAVLKTLAWQVPWRLDTTAAPAGRGGQVPLHLPSAKLMLELHGEPGSLVESVPHALDEFWSRRIAVTLGGVAAWTLPAEETLMHLSLHLGAHHRFLNAVGSLLDVTLLVQVHGPGLNWPALASRCRALGIAGWVATALGTARAMFGAPVPVEALAALNVEDLDQLCADAAEQAWRRPRRGESPQSVLSAPTLADTGARLGQRLRELIHEADPASRWAGTRQGRLFRRLRAAMQYQLPSFLRTLWRSMVHPGEGARRRRLSAENVALIDAIRARSPSGHAAKPTPAPVAGPPAPPPSSR